MRSYAEHLQRSMERADLAFEGELMNEFIYRPREVLLHKDDYPGEVQGELRKWGAEAVGLPDGIGLPGDYPILRFELPHEMSVPHVVARLRQVAAGSEPRVAANYVFAAEQARIPTPAGPARPAGGRGLAAPGETERGLTVGVVDTGVVLEDGRPHPFLAGRVTYEASDQDPLDVDHNGLLDVYDGHGTFVAGRVLEQAPDATVRIYRGLDTGVSDDLAVAAAIRRLGSEGVKLINLSFSSTVDGATYPLAVSEELAELPPDVVVVAAAGNYGRRRPFWPAAFKRVIAVGAVNETAERDEGTPPPRARWSNFGWWVDACASGVDVLGPFCDFDETAQHASNDEAFAFTGWAEWSGTSFAAPKVTGRIAQVAMEHEISARQAADRVVRDPELPQIRGLGTYVS